VEKRHRFKEMITIIDLSSASTMDVMVPAIYGLLKRQNQIGETLTCFHQYYLAAMPHLVL
jgi:hypothetical protein